MNLDVKHWILLIAAGVLALLALIAAGSYLGAREDGIKLKATMDAQNQVIQAIDAGEKKRDAALQDFMKAQQVQLEAVNKRFDRAQSPQDIAALVGQLMGLQKPITFVTPPATPANPNPQPVAQVPIEDAPQVKSYVKACETCKLNLQTTTQQLTTAQQTHADDVTKLGAVAKERDAAVKAAKGGSL